MLIIHDTDKALDDAWSLMNVAIFSNEALGIANENDSNNNAINQYPNFTDISEDELK